MSKSFIGSLTIAGCSLLVGSAFAQEDRSSPTEMVRLSDGSFIRFERYDGVLLRLKEGRQVARVKLPKAEPIEKRTDVVVSKDETRRMTRWFDLGGERRGIWLGPMFLDYYDLTLPLAVKTEGCAAIEASETGSPKTIDASEHPAHVVVLIRKAGLKQSDGPTTGEVWFVSSDITGPPKLVATLARRPTTGNTLRRRTSRDAGKRDALTHSHRQAASARAASSFLGRIAHAPNK